MTEVGYSGSYPGLQPLKPWVLIHTPDIVCYCVFVLSLISPLVQDSKCYLTLAYCIITAQDLFTDKWAVFEQIGGANSSFIWREKAGSFLLVTDGFQCKMFANWDISVSCISQLSIMIWPTQQVDSDIKPKLTNHIQTYLHILC